MMWYHNRLSSLKWSVLKQNIEATPWKLLDSLQGKMFILKQEIQINGEKDCEGNSGTFHPESDHDKTLSVTA